MIEHDTDGLGVRWIAVAGLKHKNFCGIHFHPRTHKSPGAQSAR
jgi:hypothetical protein